MARSSPGTASNHIYLGTYGPLAGSGGPFTIAIWMKSASTTQTEKYLVQSTNYNGTRQWAVIFEYVNDTVEFFAAGATGSDPRIGSGLTIADTNWHHIAYRKDASGASNWDKFRDGAKTNISSSISFTLGSDIDRFYTHCGLGAATFNGALAEVAIWSAALNDGEVAALAKGCSPQRVKRANLLIHWSLQGFGGTNEPDLSGNSRNGLIVNTTISDHPPVQAPFAGTPYPPVTLEAAVLLAGTTGGKSVVSGTVEVTRALAGSTAGKSEVAGNLGITRLLAGLSAGKSTVEGSLSVFPPSLSVLLNAGLSFEAGLQQRLIDAYHPPSCLPTTVQPRVPLAQIKQEPYERKGT